MVMTFLDIVQHRLQERNKILRKDRIVQFCNAQLTGLFNDINKPRLTAAQIAELKRFRDEYEGNSHNFLYKPTTYRFHISIFIKNIINLIK